MHARKKIFFIFAKFADVWPFRVMRLLAALALSLAALVPYGRGEKCSDESGANCDDDSAGDDWTSLNCTGHYDDDDRFGTDLCASDGQQLDHTVCMVGTRCHTVCGHAFNNSWGAFCLWEAVARLPDLCAGNFTATHPDFSDDDDYFRTVIQPHRQLGGVDGAAGAAAGEAFAAAMASGGGGAGAAAGLETLEEEEEEWDEHTRLRRLDACGKHAFCYSCMHSSSDIDAGLR